MTIGTYLDLLLHGMLQVLTPVYSLAMGFVAVSIAFIRWWLNHHYNYRRAIVYAKTTAMVLLLGLILSAYVVKPGPEDIKIWQLMGLFVWIGLFVTLGYFLAAAFATRKGMASSEIKLRTAAKLRLYADQIVEMKISRQIASLLTFYARELEKSADVPPTPPSVAEKTIQVVKEVINDNIDTVKPYIGMF